MKYFSRKNFFMHTPRVTIPHNARCCPMEISVDVDITVSHVTLHELIVLLRVMARDHDVAL